MMFMFFFAFFASLLTSGHPLLFKKDTVIQSEAFPGYSDPKEFFNDRNILIDLIILVLGIKTLFSLGFCIYKESSFKNVEGEKECKTNFTSPNLWERERNGCSEDTSFEDNLVNNNQLEPAIASGCSSFLETSSIRAEHAEMAELNQDTVIIDNMRVPKTIVDLIDVIVLRTTSLETQLLELKEQQSSAQSQQQQQQQQNEQQQGAAIALPDYLPEDEEKRPLPAPRIYQPARGDWAQVRENALEFLAENENSDLPSCIVCVGITLAFGFAAYKLLAS